MLQVTVILPVYNGANYLAQSIQSVLAQDFDDFELHVLDDCSEDESARIAQSTGDSRVCYSRNPERYGLFKTLNRGFEEAETSLVRIWTQDDIMLPAGLRAFVDFTQRHPTVGMVYSDFYVIDAQGQRTGREAAYQNQRERTPEVATPELSALLFWCYGCLPGNVSTVMLRRCAWQKAGGFLTGYQQVPDYDMWVRLSQMYDIGFLRQKAIELRTHPLQLSRLGQKQMTTIEEELPVVRQLQEQMKCLFSPDELRRGWLVERGRQHVHWVARAMLRGDWSTALRGWRALKPYGQRQAQALFWLFSANGRFFVPNRDTIFDRKRAQLATSLQSAAGQQ